MMTEPRVINRDQLILPTSLVTKSDLIRLIGELERLSNALISDGVRQRVGFRVETKHTLSEQMRDLIEVNGLNLSEPTSRDQLLKQLRMLKNQAPTVHITLASQVENGGLAELVKWFRQEVHHQTMLIIGLQPGLIGGIYVRTPNHVYDYSVKSQLEGHSDIIAKQLEAISGRS